MGEVDRPYDGTEVLFWSYFFMTGMLLFGIFLNGISMLLTVTGVVSWAESTRVLVVVMADLLFSTVFATVITIRPVTDWFSKKESAG